MNLDRIHAELEQQNQALETAMKQLQNLGDVQIQLPEAVLRELDEACTVHATAGTLDLNHLTGVRA
jgi:hypothetical protein